ncbi:helix-turn-helix domain-containing protein [Sphingomonas sanxanigenens]|uniref:HTH luxR-type domain-containing protein n=1 Tax=Sphingomonas sanxanigenens DSM 19645 = NX02 TaxID=1123269 RepID=W0A5E0_9SPHN|nr:helix-turn-helix transcriptional regulator [Sphingomonas sanxanigenens]AHE53169.1 hypothetical protein NX02_07210 [Sphingomonas sanxanigenens DSM 19645 = NX02]
MPDPDPLDPDPVARLTPGERDCLRLVLDHKPSKEIAIRLGIGPDAVDKRIKQAMRKLGVSTRVAAARLLADADADAAGEAPDRYQRLVYQSAALAGEPEPRAWIDPQPATEGAATGFREERMAFDVPEADPALPAVGIDEDAIDGRRILRVLAAIIGIAILAALVAGGLLSAILAGQQALEAALT